VFAHLVDLRPAWDYPELRRLLGLMDQSVVNALHEAVQNCIGQERRDEVTPEHSKTQTPNPQCLWARASAQPPGREGLGPGVPPAGSMMWVGKRHVLANGSDTHTHTHTHSLLQTAARLKQPKEQAERRQEGGRGNPSTSANVLNRGGGGGRTGGRASTTISCQALDVIKCIW